MTPTYETGGERPVAENRADLLDRADSATEDAAKARAERDDAVADRESARRVAVRERKAAETARASANDMSNQLADLLEVLARHGANLDDGTPAEVLERALRDAEARGAAAAARTAGPLAVTA